MSLKVKGYVDDATVLSLETDMKLPTLFAITPQGDKVEIAYFAPSGALITPTIDPEFVELLQEDIAFTDYNRVQVEY